MTKRTDIHAPSAIRPEDYAFVGPVFLGEVTVNSDGQIPGHIEAFLEAYDPNEFEAAEAALEESPFDGNFKRKGTCDHCGAWFKYGMVYRHNPTGEHICVGNTCACETMNTGSREALELKRMKSKIAATRKLAKLRISAQKWLTENCADLEPVIGFEARPSHYILSDIQQRLWNNYPSLSDKQVELVRKILADLEAEKDAPAKITGDLHEVREGNGIRIRGVVLSTKYQDSYYGTTFKMLVLDDQGFKVWGTVPSAIEDDIEKGDFIDFIANVEGSKDDVFFGFFKRPRKAALKHVAEAA